MASIDQRIVELKFKAQNFQSGIKAAIASLDNLKKSLNLNKAASEFDKVEKASKKVKFNDLYSSVDSISQRFSTLGIIGMSALNQITTTAMQTGRKLLSALTAPLIEGGKRRALNIEQAKFQIQGLGYAWKDVEDDINYGVKDTAYGLDAAAKAASQLLASQVKVGAEMKTSLRAISGVAAMTSSEYDDIANIFTTVAGNGRLMGDQLMQLSTRGLNAAATLGQYLGKSESEVREMVSKGKIDFATFAAAMDSAFGEHAKKANETFTGSLSNMKAALSRIGAEIASPAYEHLRDVFNSLTPVFDGIKAALTSKGGLFDTIKSGMSYVAKFVTTTLNALGGKDGVAKTLAPALEKLNRITKAFGSLVLGIARTINGIVTPIFSAFAEVLGGTLLDSVGGAIEILAKFVNSIAFTERMSTNLKKTFVGIFTVINTLFKMLTAVVGFVSDIVLSVFSATFGFILDVILAITGHIGDLIVRIQKFIDDLLALKNVQDLLSGISFLFTKLVEIVTTVYNVFRNLVGIIIDSAFGSALWIFDKIAEAILAIARFIDHAVTKLREFITWVRQLPAVQRFISKVKDTFQYVRDNIGEAAYSLKNKFIDAIRRAKQVVGEFIGKLRELVSQYIEIPTLQDVISGVMEFMINLFEKAVEIFNKVKEVLGDIFDRVRDLSEMSLSTIIDNFNKLKAKMIEVIDISGRIAFLKDVFGTIKDGAASAAQGTSSTLDLIKQKLAQFIEWAKDKFNSLTIGDVMAAGIGGTFIVFLVQLTKFVTTADKLTKTLDKGFKIVDRITGSITGAIDSFKKLNEAKITAIKMDAISNLIKSVVLLAGAVALLATMDPNRVIVAAGVILILSGALIGLSAAMNAIATKTNPEAIAATVTQLLAASGSILILAIALKALSNIPVGQIISSLLAITVLMGEMMAFMVVFNKLAPEAAKDASAMLLVASSLLVLARAMIMIGSLSTTDILKSVGVITALMAGLGLMFKISRRVAITKKGIIGIVSIVASVYLLVHALKSLAKLDASTISAGLTRLMAIMATLSLLLISTKLAGEHAKGAGVAIILMSLAMNAMVFAIKGMASIDNGMLSQATKSIVMILGVFALITAMTKYAGEHAIAAGTSIMIMAGAIAIIAGAMVLLSRLSDNDIKKATAVVVSILGMFALIVAATGMSKACQKTLKQMTICLGMLLAALAILSLIEPKNILSASAAISMLIGTLAFLTASTGKIGPKAMAAIWVLVGVVGALGMVIAALAQVPNIEKAVSAATAISELMLIIGAIGIVMGALRIRSIPVAAIAELAVAIDAVILVIGALVTALGAINTYIPEFEEFLTNGIPIMQKIGQAIGEFVGGIVGGVAAGASYGLVTLGENLTKFMDALQPFLEQVSNIDDSMMDGAYKLFEMLLMFAAADFLDSLSWWSGEQNAIDSLGESLPAFGDAVSKFAESLDGVNLDALSAGAEAAKSIGEIGLIFSSGGLKGLIFGDSSLGLASLGVSLPLLGKGLKKYADSVDGLNADAINNSVGPAKSLVEISNSINGEGLSLMSIFGGSNATALNALSTNLPLLGDALKAYGESVSDLRTDAINNSIEPLRSLVDISNTIKGEAAEGNITLLSVFGGSNAQGLYLLSQNLPLLGDALKAYGDSLDGLKADQINQSIEPLRSLVDISNTINGEAGDGWSLLSIFGGSNSQGLSDLADNLPKLGKALTRYSMSLTGMKADVVNASIEPLKSLVEISNMIESEGGVSGFFGGSSSEAISNFEANLPSLGKALTRYSIVVSDLKADAVNTSVECLKNLISALNGANEGISSLFGGSTSGGIESLTNYLPTLGEALVSYSNSVENISEEKISISVEALKKIVEAVGNGAEYSEGMRLLGSDIKTFGESFRDGINALSDLPYGNIDAAVDGLNKIKEAIVNFADNFPDVGEMLGTFVNGLRAAAMEGVTTLVVTFIAGSIAAGAAAGAMIDFVIEQMVSRLKRAYADFRNHGKNLAINLSNGIRSGASSVSTALNSALNALVSKVRSYNGSMTAAGSYLMDGLRNGITSNSSGAINAAWQVGKNVVQALKDSTGVQSPSKETKKVGKFIGLGLIIGIVNYASKVINAVSNLGNEIVDEFTSISNDLDFFDDLDPVITPTIDMTEFDSGLSKMNSGFAALDSVPIGMQGRIMSSAIRNMNAKDLLNAANQNGTPSQVINNYDLTQNNYSPKPLSRIEIYRDTKNQFSRLKEVVNA